MLQNDVIDFLTKKSDAVHGTHISKIFIMGDDVYKLKRAVKLPFLDYSTLDYRNRAARREVDLNRRTAPDLYRGVVTVTQTEDHDFHLGGDGKVVEWLVHMHRFDHKMQGNHLAAQNTFTRRHANALADAIASFHQTLSPRTDKGGHQFMRKAIADVVATCAKLPDPNMAQRAQNLGTRLLNLCDQKASRLDQRRDQGMVRLCHGDMHLSNIVVIDGIVIPFDCIEFNDDIAVIDILYDLAFPVMDLMRYGHNDLANLVMNRYLAATRDYDGLDLWPLFIGARALVRTMADGMAKDSDAAARYLDSLEKALQPQSPRVIAVGGLSGSGKSSVAQAIAADRGAVLLRSDEIRKRIYGVQPETKLPPEAYSSDITKTVFARFYDDAKVILDRGMSVVLDATHMNIAHRHASEAVACEARVPFTGLWLDAPPHILEQRVGDRKNDASDATIDVLRNQYRADLGPMSWEKINAAQDLKSVIGDAARKIARP